jgi:hypothetical protein
MARSRGIWKNLGWSGTEYGWYTGAYGWFNVFLFFPDPGGIILDKMVFAFPVLNAACIMLAGTAVNYWAITTRRVSMDPPGISFCGPFQHRFGRRHWDTPFRRRRRNSRHHGVQDHRQMVQRP